MVLVGALLWSSMERAIIHWILVLTLCASFILVKGAVAAMSSSTAANAPGFITIDCGSNREYLDKGTGIWYESDTKFVETGENWKVAGSSNLNDPYFGKASRTARCFPEGVRNCYTLTRVPQQQRYLIRAIFIYNNYDGKNQNMTFDIHLGVNLWDTVSLDSNYYWSFTEIIYTHTSDSIQICLVKTGQSTPCISSLELRPLSSSVYDLNSTTNSRLLLYLRTDIASLDAPEYVRYKDDVYDRIWRYDREVDSWQSLELDNYSTAIDIGSNKSDSYKVPSKVMRTVATSQSVSDALEFSYSSVLGIELENSSEYYTYFHFAEIEQLGVGKKRIIDITINSQSILSEPLVLEYLKPVTVTSAYTAHGDIIVSISATSGSEAPPILNALEIYRFVPEIDFPTDAKDVSAIEDIKSAYQIITKLNWQGDPCRPTQFTWEGLNCTSHKNARIKSLNLRSSKLSGQINISFSYFTELEFLDLSDNELEGPVPEFLAELPKLKVLNLTKNKLSGLIPEALLKKADNKSLQLSVADNPNLCMKYSCNKKNFFVPLIASLPALIVILFILLGFWISKRRQKGPTLHIPTKDKLDSRKEVCLESKQKAFSYTEILNITDNFKTIIGEGGFGKVYLGVLQDRTQVAVKLLSVSSTQGYKEFQSEVELHSSIRHRNLVSLVGYCDEGEIKALIYEYMANGNLHRHLSKQHPNVLKWDERLNIAIDVANGLDYLHNGCKTPIVHRDLKTSNILLDKWNHAKISDFGLSRAFPNDDDSHISTRPAGTPGYIDPEFHRVGYLNKKSDVYSLGIILLELMTGEPAIIVRDDGAIHILEWVRPILERGDDIQNIVDSRLLQQGDFNVDSLRKVFEIALCCTRVSAQRPDISQVLLDLKDFLFLEMVSIAPDMSMQLETEFSLVGR
ncbi:probable LRR receptor-like serine/threonine-protein kinase At1g05700 [Arachis stenosperma]|uniref:probable LRR receptor-like serine/threonine-protein kinase At1g05700 n=1 Tax=Arachis stenosperma TaxID=217475 RepID=UPI0025ACDBA4|nr:probable LRR receptor-like serine/threonine-protein kinase At1g05700 [Arachis stenosperma]